MPAVGRLVLVYFFVIFGFATFEGTLALFTADAFKLDEKDNFLVFAYIGFVLMVVEGLLRLALPAAALVAVVLAVRRAGAARTRDDRLELPPAEDEVPAVTAAPDRLPAAWQADEATGAVWLTADDAAQGRPGLSWSDPAATATAGAVASGPWAPPAAAAEEPAVRTTAAAPADAEDDDLR